MERKIRIAAFSMIWTGVFSLLIVGYQLFVTDLLNDRAQAAARLTLDEELEARRDGVVAVTVTTEPAQDGSGQAPTTTTPIVHLPEEPSSEGDPLGVIRIPDIGMERVVFGGVAPGTLTEGPGHMPWTPVPGQPGNAVISGHRTTHGAPFFDLDLLEPGDTIEVETAIGIHTYTVRDTIIVAPTDVWVTEPRPGAWLTLTTCNPKFSAAERMVVQAELTDGPNLEYSAFLEASSYGTSSYGTSS